MNDDFPLLRGWLAKDHVREWWSDPESELASIRAKVEGRDKTRPFIFSVNGKPTGYIQYWTVRDALAAGYGDDEAWLFDLPEDAVGVDVFIGRDNSLDKGIGTAVLRAFLAELFARGFGMIVIDPDLTNRRAIRAYEKAGFTPFGRYEDKKGVTQIMQISSERFAETAR